MDTLISVFMVVVAWMSYEIENKMVRTIRREGYYPNILFV
jgi:hypothetical protein